MPATAGRVRMPQNNRVHSSSALQTHSIWKNVIIYDPHAPIQDDTKGASQSKTEDDSVNLYADFQDWLARARMIGSNTDEARGACKKCGLVGHLPFQCRNSVSVKDDKNEKDLNAIQAYVMAELGKIKGSLGKRNFKSGAEIAEDSSEDESESSDSSEDSEMERIIAQRFRNKCSSKSKSLNRKKDLSNEDSEPEKRRRRGRSKKTSGRKRSESVSDDDARRKRKEKRRKRDESSDEEEQRRHRRKSRKEKRRRRSHRHSDDSEDSEEFLRQDKRKSRRGRSPSDSEVSYSDDSRVGGHSKRSDKKSLKRTREDDE